MRKPERYRYVVHPPIPKHDELTRSEALAIAVGMSTWCAVASCPLWWDCDGLPVLGYTVGAAVGIYGVLRVLTAAPKVIRAIRKKMRRGLPMWLTPVYSIREKNTFGGYIPREVICRAAKGETR